MPEDTGIIKGFNHKEFAQNLSSQAKELIPKDISEEDQKFIEEIVYKFCLMSGEALNKDNTISINANQACLISQFIGEWSFHKTIDLIRGNIEMGLRESILQKIAFTIFEIAKQGVIKNMPQEQLIPLVEHHVTKTYNEALEDLTKRGVISKDVEENASKQSNIDVMARQQVKQENPHMGMSDAKILKLASLAFLIKNLPSQKIDKIINKFDEREANILHQYLKMSDLEKRLNPSVAAQCLQDMKKHLPAPKGVSYDRCYLELKKMLLKTDENAIDTILKDERPLIKDFVKGVYENRVIQMPSAVADIIYNHIKENIS